MNRVFVTGDTHGTIDVGKLNSKNFKIGAELDKGDFVIIAGDFGFIWSNTQDKHEEYWMKWFQDKPWTTLVIPGNHENYNRIFKLPVSEMFGGKVRKYNDSLILLERGETYTIANKTFWVMGGGLSIDRSYRILGYSWWPQELPMEREYINGEDSLTKIDGKVDYIITHVAPLSALKYILKNKYFRHPKYKDPLSEYLEHIFQNYIKSYKHWYCGHYHDDIDIEDKKLSVLYNRIVELT